MVMSGGLLWGRGQMEDTPAPCAGEAYNYYLFTYSHFPPLAEHIQGQLPPDNGLQGDAPPRCAPEAGRVCQAWPRTNEVKVLVPGNRGAEG